ncbi:MAG: ABC transporter substrate-binding protein, partial [Thermoprotei archaeon]
TGTIDALDPATGFNVPDQPIFNVVFQELVEFNGSSYTQVVPVLASNYTVSNNYQTYIFQIRPNVTFSNGDPLNAYDVWFSFVRELYLGQAVGSSNYAELTFNPDNVSVTGMTTPWGLLHALQNVTALPTTTNFKLASTILNQMLSNFNPDNSTIQKVMSYPDQAYVVLGPYTFEVNLLHPYRFFLLDIAQWWGAVVDPAYVDAHGGVVNNTVNNYFDANGGPGTGPYYIKSVGVGYSDVVLQTNPNYWGYKYKDVPLPAQPAHIPTIIVNYQLTTNQLIQDFATNRAQISYLPIRYASQVYNYYIYKNIYSFNQVFKNLGLSTGFFYLSMNTQLYPTNNTDFRLAIEHAINYTELLYSSYSFNGTLYGTNYLGPLTPIFGKYYNPDNLPLYSYNPSLAIYYLNRAGQEEHFSVTLPNGSIIGDPSAPPIGTITIVYEVPLTSIAQTQLTIIQQDLSAIGLDVGLRGVTGSVFYGFSTPQSTPNFVFYQWYPDWPDPFLQMLAPALTTTSYLPAWVNLTTINNILQVLPFLTNTTEQIQLTAKLYNITYNYAPYVWMPDPDNTLFIQPYLHGFVFNLYVYFWYNTISY